MTVTLYRTSTVSRIEFGNSFIAETDMRNILLVMFLGSVIAIGVLGYFFYLGFYVLVIDTLQTGNEKCLCKDN